MRTCIMLLLTGIVFFYWSDNGGGTWSYFVGQVKNEVLMSRGAIETGFTYEQVITERENYAHYEYGDGRDIKKDKNFPGSGSSKGDEFNISPNK